MKRLTQDDVVSEHIATLEARKTQLQRMLTLRSEVAGLERQLLLGSSPLDGALKLIIDVVCTRYNLTPALVMSRNKEYHIAHPRQMIFYFANRLTGRSSAELEDAFQTLTSSAIRHAFITVRDRIKTEPAYKAEVAAVEAAIKDSLALLEEQAKQTQ